jgi:CubicO group peptidase (beta-lactamase class C family)
MKSFCLRVCIAATLVAPVAAVVGCGPAVPQGVAGPIHVPRIEGLVIDGRGDDWAERGYAEAVLPGDVFELPPADFVPSFRAGWDDTGFYLLCRIRDADAHVVPDAMWQGDSVEVFLAAGDPENRVKAILAPRAAGGEPFTELHDLSGKGREVRIRAAAVREADEMRVELLVPWSNLETVPAAGDEVALELRFNDGDSPGHFRQVPWRRDGERGAHPVRLSAEASASAVAVAGARYERSNRLCVRVAGGGELAGRSARVLSGRREVARGRLKQRRGWAVADVRIDEAAAGALDDRLMVLVDTGGPPCVLEVLRSQARAASARVLVEEPIVFRHYCFAGTGLPEGDFARPERIRALFGPYEIETVYYDADYNEVSRAARPGRYGAVITFRFADGRTVRRFRTLMRLPDGVEMWDLDVRASVRLPEAFGISPAAARSSARTINEYVRWRLIEAAQRDPGSAALLAGLHAAGDEAPSERADSDVWAIDRQWWVGLKRKLYGTDKRFDEPFVCPRIVEGLRAPVLRGGSLKAAGMKDDAKDKIDAVCTAWAADSDEAFAVCVARNGIVVLHKAYGTRDGKPMTVAASSWMASITKLMSATLMMMLVDQGLVAPDDPVSRFLPPFAGRKMPTPLTVRHLYTHTSGLWGHWGDDLHDLEEILGEYCPHLEVAKRYAYNGAGFALGGKIIEAVTGEAVPVFYRRHLLEPLGMRHTTARGTSGDAESTALDMARLAQMLLNRGAYGNMRFLRPETFERMLPRRLTSVLGPDAETVYGFGTACFEGSGLGEGTFGHGAASSATLRIDPQNKLVITVCRNRAGRNFGRHHRAFIQAIVDGMADGG